MKYLIDISGAGIGDILVTIPYLEKFRVENSCEVYFKVKHPNIGDIFKKSYPHINFFTRKDENIIFDRVITLTHDNHTIPLQQIFAEQLGYKNAEYLQPIVDDIECERPIKNRYVVISMQSTSQCKYWNHIDGKLDNSKSTNWVELCKLLRNAGITPVCVDYHETFGVAPHFNSVPKNSVKKQNLSFIEILKYLKHCEFYIGLSSGVTWMAHAMNRPICMISNFTEEWNEMDINNLSYIRITNKNVCNGCWNKVGIEHQFDAGDWYWCPKYKNTNRQFECHTSISPMMVFNEIKKWIN